MAVIKRATIPSGTLKLKRLKNDMKETSSNRYKYVVEFPDGDQSSPRFTKTKAMTEFNRVKNNRQETTSSSTTSKKKKAKGIFGKIGSAASKLGSGGSDVMEEMESGGGIDPLGLEGDKSSKKGSLDEQLGIDMGGESGDLDMDLEDFD